MQPHLENLVCVRFVPNVKLGCLIPSKSVLDAQFSVHYLNASRPEKMKFFRAANTSSFELRSKIAERKR